MAYSIYNDAREVVFTVAIDDLIIPARVINRLIYEDTYYPEWFGLKNHTVTMDDLIRIYNTPNLVEKTPNWRKKTLEWFAQVCTK
jgi:hypothetical protein